MDTRIPTTLLALLGLALAPSSAHASTWIVDASGGAGAHFTDLQAAISAASDGDILRVRAGRYSPFVLANKGLSILGDDPGTVLVEASGPISIGPTLAHQSILLQDIQFVGASQLIYTAYHLTLRRTAGPVVLRGVGIASNSWNLGPLAVVDACAQVHFHDCEIDPQRSWIHLPPLPTSVEAALAMRSSFVQLAGTRVQGLSASDPSPQDGRTGILVDGSELFVTGGEVRGGKGYVYVHHTYTPGKGGAAVQLVNASRLTVHGRSSTRIQGGEGASFIAPLTIVHPGDGGDGIQLAGGSQAIVLGTSPEGGPGGTGIYPLAGQPGQPWVADASSTIAIQPLALPPIARIVGSAVPGGVAGLQVEEVAGSQAFLAVGLRSRFLPLPSPLTGALLVDVGLLLGPLAVPASGILEYPLGIAPGFPLDSAFHLQFLTLPAPGGFVLSNSLVFLVKS